VSGREPLVVVGGGPAAHATIAAYREAGVLAAGDGFEEVRTVDHGDGALTAWYGRDGVVVGVRTHEADDAYAAGRELVETAGPFPPAGA